MRTGVFSLFVAMAMAFALLSASVQAGNFRLGAAFATNHDFAHRLTGNRNFNIYHTWQFKSVSQLSRAGWQWVPMRWGNKKSQNWPWIKRSIKKHRYPYVLAYNEPDVSSQAGYSPGAAASAFQRELAPLRRYGAQISSPQICWSIPWLKSFMKILKSKGGHVDFVAVHYYGSWKSIDRFKKYIKQVHSTFGKEVWLTEFGVTTASRPSAGQAKQFMVQAIQWLQTQDYVKTAMPFGFFTHPPDNYGSGQVRVFRGNGALTSIGQYYRHFDLSKRSLDEDEGMPHAIRRRHHALLKRLAESEPEADDAFDDQYDGDEEHCDEMCKQQEAFLDDDTPFDIDAPLTEDEVPKESDEIGHDDFTEEDALAEVDDDEDDA